MLHDNNLNSIIENGDNNFADNILLNYSKIKYIMFFQLKINLQLNLKM